MQKRTYKNNVPLTNESGDIGFHETKMEKKVIKEDKPIQIGQAILQRSKLHFLQFVKFLDDFLVQDSFKFCYADTDSMCIGKNSNIKNKFKLIICFLALTKTDEEFSVKDPVRTRIERMFLPIVKPGLKNQFLEEMKKWFTLEDTPEELRRPGLLKGKKQKIKNIYMNMTI